MYICGITGGTGTLGKFLLKNLPFKFIKYKGRVENKKNLSKWILKNKFDLILHLAAIVPTNQVKKNFKKALKVNYGGTKNLVDIINKKKNKPAWLFFASTSHVYNFKHKKKIDENYDLNPSTKYGITKFKAEKYIKKYLKIKYAIGRIFSYTHFDQSGEFLIPSLFKKIKNKKRVFKNLNHFRDFIHIQDITSAIKFMWLSRSQGVFNIGSGKKTHLKKIAKFLNFKINRNYNISFIENKNCTHLIANNKKLKKLGWKVKKNINNILKDYLRDKK